MHACNSLQVMTWHENGPARKSCLSSCIFNISQHSPYLWSVSDTSFTVPVQPPAIGCFQILKKQEFKVAAKSELSKYAHTARCSSAYAE
ncbi:hypothetical protein FKM82_010041 [Ascaphus truei]